MQPRRFKAQVGFTLCNKVQVNEVFISIVHCHYHRRQIKEVHCAYFWSSYWTTVTGSTPLLALIVSSSPLSLIPLSRGTMRQSDTDTKQGARVLQKIRIISKKPATLGRSSLIVTCLILSLISNTVVTVLASILLSIYQVESGKFLKFSVKMCFSYTFSRS